MMDERHLHKIREHLRSQEARERVRQRIERVRNEATVTIGRAARLFGFSESQLRDWEKSGLLSPQRPREGGEGHGGQRQYSLTELDKLAIIRELINGAGMSPGSIPSDVDEIWMEIEMGQRPPTRRITQQLSGESLALDVEISEYIDRRVENTYYEHLCWRYYTSHALWLSLLLIHEDVPGFQSGLVLPFYEWNPKELPQETEHLPRLGMSLVGWLGQTRSFYTLLARAPAFEVPTDYSILPLHPEELCEEFAPSPVNATIVVVQRGQERRTHRNKEVVGTIRRLLEPLYEDRDCWKQHLGTTMHDLANPNIDFTAKVIDGLLTGLANMVIRLGGKKVGGENRWNVCNILLPDNTNQPLYQHSLIVRAKSQDSRMEVGTSTILPERNNTSLSLRAYQGGHVVYRPILTREDITYHQSETEGPIQSNIALPIGGETGRPLGVLYVSSFDPNAFSIGDQRVLRIMARIMEELINSYRIRQQASAKLVDLLRNPGTVDPLFQEFPSEANFFSDVEDVLTEVSKRALNRQAPNDHQEECEISFIAIDIEPKVQGRIAYTYGDQTLRNLNKIIGVRIRDLLPTLFTNHVNCTLYHIYAARYYIFLRDFDLKKTRENAVRLYKVLHGDMNLQQSDLPDRTLLLQNIEIRLGVTHYAFDKLTEFFVGRQSMSVSSVSRTLYHSLNSALKLGMDKAASIIAWDPNTRTLAPYPAQDSFI